MFFNIGLVEGNEFYVCGNFFYDCFNIGIGVFGIDNFIVEDNVVYYMVGFLIWVVGKFNSFLWNLVVYFIFIYIYDGREDKFNIYWFGVIEVYEV